MPRGISTGKTDAAVQNHLRERGFTGYIRVDSHTDDDGRAATVVRRSYQAAPWTAHLLPWIVQNLADLPGASRPVTRDSGQGVAVTWEGVR